MTTIPVAIRVVAASLIFSLRHEKGDYSDVGSGSWVLPTGYAARCIKRMPLIGPNHWRKAKRIPPFLGLVVPLSAMFRMRMCGVTAIIPLPANALPLHLQPPSCEEGGRSRSEPENSQAKASRSAPIMRRKIISGVMFFSLACRRGCGRREGGRRLSCRRGRHIVRHQRGRPRNRTTSGDRYGPSDRHPIRTC